MAMTFTGLIDETLSQVRSFVRDQELATWLTFGITEGATQADVNDASIISRGRIEIGGELLVVEAVDTEANRIFFPPYGRGSDGTTPSDHAAGSKVTVQPLFPRKVVADTLNQVINSVSHKLFGISVVTLTSSPTRVSYQLPAETTNVLSVQFVADRSSTRDVYYAREWTFDQQAEWPTGKGLLLYDYQTPGYPITVTTAVDPVPLAEGDNWADSLLPDSAWDVIMLGAVARLLSTAGSYLAATRSVGSQTTLSAQMDPQTPMQISRYFYGQHQDRLEQEVGKLLARYSSRVHYQRGR